MDLTAIANSGIRTFRGVVTEGVLPVVFGVERVVIAVARWHLAQLDGEQRNGDVSPASDDAETPPPPSTILRDLLERAVFNSPEESRDELYRALLAALVPDEARIMAALSDGTSYPVVHIGAASGGSALTLINASTVGRRAGVSVPEYTPIYLSRLEALGLIDIGGEGPDSMSEEYELLMTDETVTLAQARARRGLLPPRTVRRTVGISALGQQLWEAAK